MKTIRSKDNPIYKSALKLTKKKYRDDTGLYLLEGIKPLQDAFRMGISVKTVFVREETDGPVFCPIEIAITLDRKLFGKLSDTEASQGVIAIAEKEQHTEHSFSEAVGGGNIVIMDRLQDPGNIGTIIRTAEAAGYRGIIMMAGSADVYAPKVARAAAGSLLRMPILLMKDPIQTAAMVKKMNKKLAITSLDASASCFETDLTENIALVIGNEGQGVREDFIKASDIRIKIPMEGSIESLNAAVAAGILMYQSQKRK